LMLVLNAKIPRERRSPTGPRHISLPFVWAPHAWFGGGCVLQYSGTNARMHETKLPLPETAVFANSIVGLIGVPGFPHSLDYYSDG